MGMTKLTDPNRKMVLPSHAGAMAGVLTVPKILLIDDDDVFLEVIERALNEAGFNSKRAWATSLSDADTLLAKDTFDCILLDHKLDDGDAFSLLDKLAQTEDSPAVIILTNNDDVNIAVRAMKYGVVDFINKDKLDGSMLKEAIENGIEARNRHLALDREKNALQRMSFYDELTGLANRHLLADRLTQAIKSAGRNRHVFALFVMDLNLFKDVNDTYGHDAGDEVLRVTAARISNCLRDTDTVGRLGGDEFVAVLEGTQSVEGAVVAARKISDEMALPILIEGNNITVGISVGIALYPENGDSSASLMKAADVAMYQAKSAHEYFHLASAKTADMDERPKRIASGLQTPGLINEIEIHYQPTIEFDSPDICGVEALTRWKHPKLGLLQPIEFIPALERTAAVKHVTLHTIERAFEQYASWRKVGLDLPIAINISSRMLEESQFPALVEQRISKFGVQATKFSFEFSGFSSLKNQMLAINIIREIALLGIKISFDDFGVGTMSYQHLSQLPVSGLKIDPSFLVNLANENGNRAVVRSISVLAEGFGCELVAVGVDSVDTWEQLICLGCRKGQGFYFAPPMPADEITQWHDQWHQALSFAPVVNRILPAIRQI